MDQSTQVNFSSMARNQHGKMKRHNTSGDLLYAAQQQRALTLSQSWVSNY